MKNISALLILLTLFTACKKTEKRPEPVSAVTSISGTVMPTHAAGSVILMNTVTNSHISVPVQNGSFVLPEISKGEYLVNVRAVTGFTGPEEFTFQVKAGSNTIPTINLVANPRPVMAFTAGGVTYATGTQNTCTFSGTNLTLSSGTYSTSLNGPIRTQTRQKLDFTLSAVNGTGSYTINPGSGENFRLSLNTSVLGTGTVRIWSAADPGSAATVHITSINKVSRMVSGTYTATLIRVPASAGTPIEVNGTFENYSY